MGRSKRFIGAALLAATLGLAACDTAEERAEAHFQSAMELLEAGDVDRAVVEFRNVLSLNESHREARLAYAKIMRDRGKLSDAYGQYLYVTERYPTEIEPRVALAEIATMANSWDEAERHTARALEMQPENTTALAVNAILTYRQAILDEDEPARREAANDVRRLAGDLTDPKMAQDVLIDSLMRDGDYVGALAEIEAALELTPDSIEMHRRRLGILNRLGEEEKVQAGLEDMVARFPEDEAFRNTLVDWYVSRGNEDAAEAFLRARAEAAGDQAATEYINLVVFLRKVRGSDVALAELEKVVASGQTDPVLRTLMATLRFDAGRREEAVAGLEEILATAEPSDAIRNVKITLARMHMAMGNQVAGRALIEEVLAEDSSNVEGLKMKAGWLIPDDRVDEAIIALRTALDQAPRDPEIMSLMADAHLRNGSRGLARDMLALAVEASNSAPQHALSYARFLVADDNLSTAEAVLIDSLRVAPGTLPVLVELGGVYVRMEDWARAEQVEATLRRLDTDAGRNAAQSLEVMRLQRQDRGEDAIALLESLSRSASTRDAAEIAIVRSYFRSGDFDKAEVFIDEALAKEPDRDIMRYMKAALLSSTERYDEAEAVYRELLAASPENQTVWRTLYSMLRREGKPEEATALLDEGLAANPTSPDLLWARAGELEAAGRIDEAIEIYEGLYERNSRSTVVANNLASLITSYRDSAEDLDRAYTIARRLRGSEVPAFQDTYGWIAYRRGFYDEALEHLEPAAAAQPDDAMVQFHYAMTLAALERNEEALATFRRAVELAGPADTRPQFTIAREQISRLEAVGAEGGNQ